MRWIVGCLLIVAAVLKAWDLYHDPAVAIAAGSDRWLLPCQIGGELGLGMAAMTGLYWRQLRWLAALLFAGFGSYSFSLALRGAASCGCFGPIEISPWWTFTLDVVVLAGLVSDLSRNRISTPSAKQIASSFPVGMHAVGIFILSATVAVGLSWRATPRHVFSESLLVSIGGLTILEPETWTNHPFPLAEFIDLDMSQGKWTVLLHRHDCPKCQDALPEYELLADRMPHINVALIEVPPYFQEHSSRTNRCHVGRLSSEREWFVETPVELQLQDGIVQMASTDLSSLADHEVVTTAVRLADKVGSQR